MLTYVASMHGACKMEYNLGDVRGVASKLLLLGGQPKSQTKEEAEEGANLIKRATSSQQS